MKGSLALSVAACLLILSCGNPAGGDDPPADRGSSIPDDAVKMTPDTDLYPPVLHSGDWEEPVPLEGPLNTAGVEDAPVVSADGEKLFFFFTPDASVPAEQQIVDGFTGIWWCQRDGGSWTEPVRAVLCSSISLDGPMALQSDTLWFASIREGTWGDDGDIFRAVLDDGSWSWWNAGQQLNSDHNAGEIAVGPGGTFVVYARGSQYGQYGGYDLWSSSFEGGQWSDPANLGPSVNSAFDDGWPCLSPDGDELWFTRTVSSLGYPGPAIFRSSWNGVSWDPPEEILSGFVGDPAVDSQGDLYFTHVYADSSWQIIETDIYIATRR